VGQALLVLSGLGRVQREGGPIEVIRPGDIVWFAPGEKHWHGASPDCAMSHIAIAEKLNGNTFPRRSSEPGGGFELRGVTGAVDFNLGLRLLDLS